MKGLKSFFCLVVFVLLFFSEILSQYFGPFAYVDEIIALFAIVYIVFKRKINKNKKVLFYLIVLFMLGIFSNIASKLALSNFAILVDAFTMYKAFILFIAFKDLNENNPYRDKTLKYVANFSKVMIIFAFIFLILNFLNLVNMTEAIRYGLKEYKFIFINAGTLGYYLIAILPLIEETKNSFLYKLLVLILIFSTLKGPQLIFVVLYIYFSFSGKRNKLLNFIQIMMLPVLALVLFNISSYQIENYLLNKTSARYLLTSNAFRTANDYFPLGSGFSTYGSEMSRRYYSPLYNKYGFYKVWGLGLGHTSFINDNYWQMILGQLGYFGLLLNALLIFTIFKQILKMFKNSKHINWVKSMMLCILIGSLGSAYITSCAFVIIMLSLCLVYRGEDINEKKY